MTNIINMTGETAVVNTSSPVLTSVAVDVAASGVGGAETTGALNHHHALRSATKKAHVVGTDSIVDRIDHDNEEEDDDEMALEALVAGQEDKMMVDEEITSVEDNQEAAEKMDRAMLAVALVKSVVETKKVVVAPGDEPEESKDQEVTTETGQDKGGQAETQPGASPRRYGLRKRPRPSGQDLARLEHFQSSTEGGLARGVLITTMDAPPPTLTPAPATTSVPIPIAGPGRRKSTEVIVAAAEVPPVPPPVKPVPSTRRGSRNLASTPALNAKPVSVGTTEAKQCLLEAPTSVMKITSVPNPLLQHEENDIGNSQNQPLTESATEDGGLSTSLSLTVPCPLSGGPSVPAASVTVGENTPNQKSVIIPGDISEKRKVTINEQVETRMRGFSIDMDLGLEFPDDSSASVQGSTSDLPLGGSRRDRAFSFECFVFGISADEPLPPLGHPYMEASDVSYADSRPRGDSIIFDPVSFQEGGIHEQTALERGRAMSLELPIGLPKPDPTCSSTSPVDPVVSSSSDADMPPNQEVNDEIPVLSNAPKLTTGAPTPSTVPPVTSSTLQELSTGPCATSSINLELVNKDGRIGIYLPEARRARIARFHAKRASRIWRKRIKYDCRKKLADSRPRIKGRFVKRSDVED